MSGLQKNFVVAERAGSLNSTTRKTELNLIGDIAPKETFNTAKRSVRQAVGFGILSDERTLTNGQNSGTKPQTAGKGS